MKGSLTRYIYVYDKERKINVWYTTENIIGKFDWITSSIIGQSKTEIITEEKDNVYTFKVIDQNGDTAYEFKHNKSSLNLDQIPKNPEILIDQKDMICHNTDYSKFEGKTTMNTYPKYNYYSVKDDCELEQDDMNPCIKDVLFIPNDIVYYRDNVPDQ